MLGLAQLDPVRLLLLLDSICLGDTVHILRPPIGYMFGDMANFMRYIYRIGLE